jgi:RNA ligase (TIGR02306 family)
MKLASVEIIKNIKPHANADKLEIAEVLGWQTVIKKGAYSIGEKIAFINIDTIVPRASWSEFLVDSKNPDKQLRIKNIKLRGEYSSGLVLKLEEVSIDSSQVNEGDDLTEALGIKKYVKELPANLAGENVGDFPTHLVSKTDEDNGLSHLDIVEEVLKFPSLTITQKLDGSSITIIIDKGTITEVCSRNLSKKDTENSLFWKIARTLTIPHDWTGIIQGEVCGNGIQGNPLKLNNVELYVFQIKQEGHYLDFKTMSKVCTDTLNCKTVPLVCFLDTSSTISLWDEPLKKLQELADRQLYPFNEPAEGIVIRPSSYPRSRSSRRPLGFKLINRNYNDT